MGESIRSYVNLLFLPPTIASVTRTPWATEVHLFSEFKEEENTFNVPCSREEFPRVLWGKLLPALWPSILFATVPMIKTELPPFSISELLLDLSRTLPWFETLAPEDFAIKLSLEGAFYFDGDKHRFRVNIAVSSKGFERMAIGQDEIEALVIEHIIECHPGPDYHIKTWWSHENSLVAPVRAMGEIETAGIIGTRTAAIDFTWELIDRSSLTEGELIDRLKIALEEMEMTTPSKAEEIRATLRRLGIKL
jgi:hypothetical protein